MFLRCKVNRTIFCYRYLIFSLNLSSFNSIGLVLTRIFHSEFHKMEKQRGNEVTCYKIICNNLQSSSQDLFEIENSCIGREVTFPIHEEYKLQHARSEFSLDTNTFCNEILEDLEASKMDDLRKLEQSKQFLKKSEVVLGNLKRHRTVFAERSRKFTAESRRLLKLLNNDSQVILEEVHGIQKELNDLLSSFKK